MSLNMNTEYLIGNSNQYTSNNMPPDERIGEEREEKRKLKPFTVP